MTAFVYTDIIVYPFLDAWAVAARLEVAGSCKTDDMNSLLLVSSLHSGFSSGHGISGDTWIDVQLVVQLAVIICCILMCN